MDPCDAAQSNVLSVDVNELVDQVKRKWDLVGACPVAAVNFL